MHSARWRLACDSREWIAVNLVIANQRRYCDIQHLETACRNQQSGNDYTWLSYWELWFRLPVDSFDSSLWVGSLDGAPADLKGPRRPVRLSEGWLVPPSRRAVSPAEVRFDADGRRRPSCCIKYVKFDEGTDSRVCCWHRACGGCSNELQYRFKRSREMAAWPSPLIH